MIIFGYFLNFLVIAFMGCNIVLLSNLILTIIINRLVYLICKLLLLFLRSVFSYFSANLAYNIDIFSFSNSRCVSCSNYLLCSLSLLQSSSSSIYILALLYFSINYANYYYFLLVIFSIY